MNRNRHHAKNTKMLARVRVRPLRARPYFDTSTTDTCTNHHRNCTYNHHHPVEVNIDYSPLLVTPFFWYPPSFGRERNPSPYNGRVLCSGKTRSSPTPTWLQIQPHHYSIDGACDSTTCDTISVTGSELGEVVRMKPGAKDALGQALQEERLHVKDMIGELFVGNSRSLGLAERVRIIEQEVTEIPSLEIKISSLED